MSRDRRTLATFLLAGAVLALVHGASWLFPSVPVLLKASVVDRLFQLRSQLEFARPAYDETVAHVANAGGHRQQPHLLLLVPALGRDEGNTLLHGERELNVQKRGQHPACFRCRRERRLEPACKGGGWRVAGRVSTQAGGRG